MTDIEKKALEQAVAAAGRRMQDYAIMAEENVLRQSIVAHARAIEQHEAFKREVSDAIDSSVLTPETEAHLSRFIIAKPVDPLVEVINDADDMVRKPDAPSYAEAIRAALAARGLEIREKQ